MSTSIIRTLSMVGLLLTVIVLATMGSYVGLFLSGCLGFVFLYILVISLWIRRGDIHAARMIHQQRILSGDRVEVSITINLPARYWLCWIVVEERWIQHKNDRLHEEIGEQQKKQKKQKKQQDEQEINVEQYACLAYIRGERNIKCHYTTSVKTRGLYHVHSSRVVIGDMFGLVKRVLVQEEQEAEIVQVIPVPLVGNWFRRMQQGGGAPTDYGTLRDYISGDPISSIDWKSYARYQTLKTKQLEVEDRKSMLIVMDARKSHFESIVSAVTRMVLEMNDSSAEIILGCGDRRCLVMPQHANQFGVSTEVYNWLSLIEASSSDSFAEQLRMAMTRLGTISNIHANHSHMDTNCSIIGVTMASDERIHMDNYTLNQQQSIQIVYIPQLVEIGAVREEHRDGELSYA